MPDQGWFSQRRAGSDPRSAPEARHSRHSRSRWPPRSPVLTLCVLLVVALASWGSFAFIRGNLAGGSCERPAQLTVAAAPGIAPAIAEVAEDVSSERGGECYEITVAAEPTSRVATELASDADGPDVWVPESSMWLDRARSEGAWRLPQYGQSIASSPVVFALTSAAAEELGGQAGDISWAEIIKASDADIPIGLPDPVRDPVGLSALFGIRALTADAGKPQASFAADARSLSQTIVAEAKLLFQRLPGGAATGQPVRAFPAAEAAVVRYNARRGIDESDKLAAVYPKVPVPSLDYPYVVLPGAQGRTRSAARHLLARLLNPSAAPAFGAEGLRSPRGIMRGERKGGERIDPSPSTTVPRPPAEQIEEILRTWEGVNRSARVHVLLDVSGSMAEIVPGTGRTRMQLTVAAATRGLGLFQPTTELGMWRFATRLDGSKDYARLLEFRTVAEHLGSGALGKLQSVDAVPNGATGLYDSVLAAYRASLEQWEPGKLNLVVVLTDGQNEDPDGISMDSLLEQLERLRNPRKPLPVIGIGIGPGIDPAEPEAIASATGGKAFTTPDPRRIGKVFYRALSQIMCRPPACPR